MNKTLLFLDFDGVLNSNSYIYANNDHKDHFNMINPENVALVNGLVNVLDCKVVISSTWRKLYNLADLRAGLVRRGATFRNNIIGKTDCNGRYRGDEIARFVAKPGFSDHRVVILDDDSDMTIMMPYLVKTSADYGITLADVQRCIDLVAIQGYDL